MVGWIAGFATTLGLLITTTVGTWHMIWPGTPTTIPHVVLGNILVTQQKRKTRKTKETDREREIKQNKKESKKWKNKAKRKAKKRKWDLIYVVLP